MLEDIIEERKKKLDLLKRNKLDPYPAKVRRTFSILQILENFKNLQTNAKIVFITGRVFSIRDQGGLIFIDLRDTTGKIQGVLKKNNLKSFKLIRNTLDNGDFVELGGKVFITNKGERSIEVFSLRIIVKALRPLPTDFYGLENIELRLRKRYLDILLNAEVKEMFIKKSRFWDTARNFLKERGFLEVETPVLELVPGGAEAEPFVTHHNALNTNFYLRISLEIALKKILVGGYEKIFEIGRIFRNEGIDAEHLQDYTQLEFYWAYADYNDLMKLVEVMYKKIIKATCGSLMTTFRGQKINWRSKWPIVDYYNFFQKKIGLDLKKASDKDLYLIASRNRLNPDKTWGRGRLIDKLFSKLARPFLIQPCFLINPPVDIEPLAKRLPSDPSRVARFQILACGTELGKGFSEANDPLDQRQRFEEQMRLREKGDKEAQRLDEEFLEALEYGMPPTAGFGMSERLFAVLMDKPIRETVIFPLMRQK
jgi:lysyl-tRNA synthetase class 2